MLINAIELRDNIEKCIENDVQRGLSLLIINASDDKASERYVNMKKKICNKNGIVCIVLKFEETCTQAEIIEYIKKSQHNYSGVLVQSPLYDHLNYNEIVEYIEPSKDVDGLTIFNQGAIYNAEYKGIRTCTALGVSLLLSYNEIDIKGKLVVMVGRGKMVADPLAKMLEYKGATVVKIHTKTKDKVAKMLISNADIIISCVGKNMSHIINPNIAKNVEALIGVGFRYEDGKQLQDFNVNDNWPEEVKMTSNTNGTGLATLSALLLNLAKCEDMQY